MMVLLMSIVSCNTSEVEDKKTIAFKETELKTERVFFKDWVNFGKEYTRISELSNDEIFGENNSLLSFQDDVTRKNLSPALNKFLNKDNEFQVGNEIMWYKDGNFYSFNINDKKSLDILKLNYKNIAISKNIVVSDVIESKNVKGGLSNRSYLDPNGGAGPGYQYEFRRQSYFNCGSTVNEGVSGRGLKYVNELFAERISLGPNYLCSLYLKVKLEWNPSGRKWRAAGEKRSIVIDISGSAGLTTVTGSVIPATVGAVRVYKTFDCSQDQTILLHGVALGAAPPMRWAIDMTGSIYQKINGDTDQNAWTNYVNW
jgi:hypothetical protein